MNSMVSGTDVIFETTRPGFDVGALLDAVLEVWPDGLFQDAEGEAVRPLPAALADQRTSEVREFFIYKDQSSADSWDKEGWTEQHGNDMAHFLVGEDGARPEILQLTVVIGSATGETVRLIAAVFDALGRMAAGAPAAHGPFPSGRLGSGPPGRGLHVGQGAILREGGRVEPRFVPRLDRGRTRLPSPRGTAILRGRATNRRPGPRPARDEGIAGPPKTTEKRLGILRAAVIVGGVNERTVNQRYRPSDQPCFGRRSLCEAHHKHRGIASTAGRPRAHNACARFTRA